MLDVGMREMFSEMLDEMKNNRQETRKAQKSVEQLKVRATSLQNRLARWKGTYDNLQNKIRDEQEVAAEMCNKADEYEAIIEIMEAGFERQLADQEAEYKSIIEYMDEYYSDVIEKLSPRYIEKRWVKNNGGRGKQPFLNVLPSLALTTLRCICLYFKCRWSTCRVVATRG